jgi:hypothetical protein
MNVSPEELASTVADVGTIRFEMRGMKQDIADIKKAIIGDVATASSQEGLGIAQSTQMLIKAVYGDKGQDGLVRRVGKLEVFQYKALGGLGVLNLLLLAWDIITKITQHKGP